MGQWWWLARIQQDITFLLDEFDSIKLDEIDSCLGWVCLPTWTRWYESPSRPTTHPPRLGGPASDHPPTRPTTHPPSDTPNPPLTTMNASKIAILNDSSEETPEETAKHPCGRLGQSIIRSNPEP